MRNTKKPVFKVFRETAAALLGQLPKFKRPSEKELRNPELQVKMIAAAEAKRLRKNAERLKRSRS